MIRTTTILILLLLAVAGCKTDITRDVPEIVITAHAGDDVTAMTNDILRRAGGPIRVRVVYADDFYQPANRSESPNSSAAAKVAAVMAENDITLPMVAAYLYERGYTVHPSQLPRWRWSAPTTGAPVAYYTYELVGAVGDTTLTHYVPQAVGPYRLRVRGVSATGATGPWSLVGWSDGGDGGNSLPGVRCREESVKELCEYVLWAAKSDSLSGLVKALEAAALIARELYGEQEAQNEGL